MTVKLSVALLKPFLLSGSGRCGFASCFAGFHHVVANEGLGYNIVDLGARPEGGENEHNHSSKSPFTKDINRALSMVHQRS